MTQAALNFGAPPLAQARAAGQAAQELATARAEREAPDFRARAEAAILAKLTQGPASAEDLTDHVRAAGIPFKDGRAMGNVYKGMKERGLIRIAGDCFRRNGHGTSGGHIWELC